MNAQQPTRSKELCEGWKDFDEFPLNYCKRWFIPKRIIGVLSIPIFEIVTPALPVIVR